MGINMKNYDKIDPPQNTPEFSENYLENNFFFKNSPQKSKKGPQKWPKNEKND